MEWLARNTVVTPHLILCGTEDAYLKAVKYLKVTYPNPWLTPGFAGKTHTFEQDDKLTCIVCIDLPAAHMRPDQVEVIGILIHEATHVWQELCRSIGEHLPSPEFEAYSIQCISQQLLWSYKKQREAL